jgi:tRNA-intron endonuclease
MIKTNFSGEKIISTSPEAFSLYEKSRFGEKTSNKIQYSLFETLYLLEKNKLEIFSNSKTLTEEEFIKKAKRIDPKFETKYAAFKNLRSRGLVVKTALKFGAEFRVYESPRFDKNHARWLVQTYKDSEKLNFQEFASKNRVAHSTKKNLLIAIVDEEDSIVYYEISWIKP